MQPNEIIALAIVAGIIVLLTIYESVMHTIMKNRLREARESAASWKHLYRALAVERDCLMRRVASKDCQKVICYQAEIDDLQDQLKEANAENERLSKLNETYKKQLEGKKRKAASGSANTESCK